MPMNPVTKYLADAARIARKLDVAAIQRLVNLLSKLRAANGRLFLVGVGGSAANCSHAVNDFRKLAGIEAYAPTDNVSELTARVNDEGWAGVFAAWLKTSRLGPRDVLFVMSVGGGDAERNVSPNLVEAIKYARKAGAKVAGIVGRDGGYTAKTADACVIIPTVDPNFVTPHTEAFQSLICHMLVSHPALKAVTAKWESVERPSARRKARDTQPRKCKKQE